MIPVIAIVGRPNVGKSTIFNVLTKTRDAIVADQPGVTRDRLYGVGNYLDKPFIVIDTAGLGDEEHPIDKFTAVQTWQAVAEANCVMLVIDAHDGITSVDENLAAKLRKHSNNIVLVINKIDGVNQANTIPDFYRLGFGEPIAISAAHNRGISHLMSLILASFPVSEAPLPEEAGIKIAIVGRPNVGKSTLVNRILGEERVTVFDEPGTTRDSIFIPFERRGKRYTLIDTAGVRKRSKVTETLEKFSVIKTLQAIESCHVVVFLIDAREVIAEQDLKLLGFILDVGKSLVIAINKWDGLTAEQKETNKSELDRRLTFIDFAAWHFISALHGTGVGELFGSIEQAYRSATQELNTNELTKLLEAAIETHQPPLVGGSRQSALCASGRTQSTTHYYSR